MNPENRSPSSHDTIYVFGGFRLEPARRSLTNEDGSNVPLNGRPFDVLVYLVQHAGEVVDRTALLHAVWPRRVVEDNNVTQAIATLRRKLGARHITTVAGRGYQFVTPVEELTPVAIASDSTTLHALPPPPRSSAMLRRFARWLGVAMLAVISLPLLTGLLRDAEPDTGLGAISSTMPLTTYRGEETTPAFSPDGKQVAFSWDGGTGNEDLYVVQIGTPAATRLTASPLGADRYPAWSPDGQKIAFVRQFDAKRFDVMVVPSLGGGGERKLYSGELEPISREGFPLLAWTPDSAELLVTTRHSSAGAERQYGLHRLAVATGAVEVLELGGSIDDYDTSPAVSPNGEWLAFTRYRSGERLNRVMVQRLKPGLAPAGEPELVAEGALHHSLAWGPGSDRLWFVEGGRIYEWRLGGASRIAATGGAQRNLGYVAFAPNGRSARAVVATRRTDWDLFALPLDPESHAALGPPVPRFSSTAAEQHPRFSPDGAQLAFVSGRSGHPALWIADLGSGELRQLTSLEEFVTGFPRWSPDGAQLAFHTSAPNEERVIYTVLAMGGKPKRVGNACCPGGWSADGKHVYGHHAGGMNRVVRLDVEDGSAEPLFEGELAVESADGQYLLYAKSRERGYFRRRLNPGAGVGDEERLVSDYVPATGGLAPTADGFFYVGLSDDDRPRAIRFYDYALGAARDVWPAPPNVAIGLTLSPDGRELLYSADNAEPNADLVLLEFAPPNQP